MTDEPTAAEPAWETARAGLLRTIRPLLPSSWQLVDDERARPDVQSTRVLVSQRTIDAHPTAGTRVHVVGFTITVTVPNVDLSDAELELDDEIEAFLWALDQNSYLWTTATKAIYDNRLGYQLGVQMNSQRKEPN